ncbi:MAG: cytochrome d ubiquinol oxidase subunit II, partial [Proteobacteria bacterium]|nr:cytochrome d ubiquinol oxidase subunit II [Pseudomonadota bacterium]
MLLDYETLRVIWWLLLGVLLVGFAIMDGFDLGVGILLPFVSKSDQERRVVINTVGPVWEGNQVWFVLGGGAVFAAWPFVYAVSFSGFYFAMFIVLLALILRPVAFKYRSKIDDPRWKQTCDWALFISGFVPSLIFGVAIGNVLQGVPFHFDENLRSFYTGNFFGLLNPFALLCGLVSVSMLMLQGSTYLAVKTEANVQRLSIYAARISSVIFIILFAIAGLWVMHKLSGYLIAKPMLHNGFSNPLHKTVIREIGAWIHNYSQYAWTITAPVTGFLGALVALLFVKRCSKVAFVASSLSIVGVIATVGASMFP